MWLFYGLIYSLYIIMQFDVSQLGFLLFFWATKYVDFLEQV